MPGDLWGSPSPRMAGDHGHMSAAGTAQAATHCRRGTSTCAAGRCRPRCTRGAGWQPGHPARPGTLWHLRHLCCGGPQGQQAPTTDQGRRCPAITSLAPCWGVVRARTGTQGLQTARGEAPSGAAAVRRHHMSRGRAAGSSRTNTLCLGDGLFEPAAPGREPLPARPPSAPARPALRRVGAGASPREGDVPRAGGSAAHPNAGHEAAARAGAAIAGAGPATPRGYVSPRAAQEFGGGGGIEAGGERYRTPGWGLPPCPPRCPRPSPGSWGGPAGSASSAPRRDPRAKAVGSGSRWGRLGRSVPGQARRCRSGGWRRGEAPRHPWAQAQCLAPGTWHRAGWVQ